MQPSRPQREDFPHKHFWLTVGLEDGVAAGTSRVCGFTRGQDAAYTSVSVHRRDRWRLLCPALTLPGTWSKSLIDDTIADKPRG